MRERIAMAGVRLAGLLNRALGAQTSEIGLRVELLGRIEAIDRALRSSQAWTDGAARFLMDYAAESQDADECWCAGEVLTTDGAYTKHKPIFGPLPGAS